MSLVIALIYRYQKKMHKKEKKDGATGGTVILSMLRLDFKREYITLPILMHVFFFVFFFL